MAAIVSSWGSTDWREIADVQPGWVVAEHKFNASGMALNDVLVMFSGPFFGLRWLDWWVAMEQCDTNASPTLAFNIGTINATDNGITDSAALPAWALNVTTLGRAAGNQLSLFRAQNGGHLASRGRDVRLGLHCSAAAATGSWTNKRVWMGVNLGPI